MKKGRGFFCEFSGKNISLRIIDDNTEICPEPILHHCDGIKCSFLQVYFHLRFEQLNQIDLGQLGHP